MKPNNQKRALFDAVTNIDEDLIAEAGAPRSLSFPKNIKRIAAMAAALAILITAVELWPADNEPQDLGFLTMPGVIKVYAYDMAGGTELEDMKKFELTDGGNVTSGCLILGVSLAKYGHLPLTFEVDDSQFEGADIKISINLNYGSFWKKNDEPRTDENINDYENYLLLGRNFTIQNGETIFWSPYDDREVTMKEVVSGDGGMFADVILYAECYPIGYMVIEIVEMQPTVYCARLLVSHCFPKVNGEYQNVTEDDIDNFLAQEKK